MITHDHEYLTVREAAELLRVSVPTIRRWIASGRLSVERPGVRSLRIRRSSLRKLGGGKNRHVRGNVEMETVERKERATRVDRLIADLQEINRDLLKRRGGEPLPSSVPLIRQARRARARQL
jgi:excisionase family DNA binding protein